MNDFITGPAQPAPTAAEILRDVRKLLLPPMIRFTPYIDSGKALRLDDEDRRVIWCSADDRDAILTALETDPDVRFEVDDQIGDRA